ncbi:MarR family transcriptional regulator [Streptomyces capparidis]
MDRKPRPEATPQQAVAAMDDLIALSHVGQQEIAQRLGLNITDLTCLGYVMAAEQPLTAGELARRAGLTTGAVTGVLNRLERAGYARRTTDPQDRRRVRVVPDESAAARVTAIFTPFYERLYRLFGDYTPGEIAVLTEWFTRATAEMRVSLEEIRNAGGDGGGA